MCLLNSKVTTREEDQIEEAVADSHSDLIFHRTLLWYYAEGMHANNNKKRSKSGNLMIPLNLYLRYLSTELY